MKRLLSSFLTIIMVMGILTCVPMTASAASVETLRPDEELNLTWDYGEMYGYVEVDESGYYDVTVDGEYYGDYFCAIIDGEDFYYTIGKPSESGRLNDFPYTYKNLYLEAGIQYQLYTYCYDESLQDLTSGDLTFLLTKNDYEPITLTSSEKTIITDENESQWFIIESSTAGDYKINLGGQFRGYLLDYDTREQLAYLGNGLDIATVNLDANQKYLVTAHYTTINPQPMKVSFSKQKKTISKVALNKAKCLADAWLDAERYNYKVTYTDDTSEIVDYYFFYERGVDFYLSYNGKFSDENEHYKAVGKQKVTINCGNKKYSSTITVVSYLDYFSDSNLHKPYDDLRINQEDTDYHQYFWRIKIDETNKYELYSTQWNDDLFGYYNCIFFDKNNKEIAHKNGGYNLKAGEEYILMFEYWYNDYQYADFIYSVDPMDAHGDHDHTSSKWITDKKATVTKEGKKHKECTDCGKILETAKIAELKCSKPKLKDIENTADGVKITWGKVTGADKYAVYRKTGSGSYTKIGTTTKTYYTDKKAASGKKYSYTVKAVNGGGNSDSSNSKSIEYLADPTLKTPSSTKKGIVLKWSKASGADGYMVYRKTGSGSYSKIATVKGSSKVTYTDKKAKKGKTYTYKIKAYDGKTYSAYSNAKKIKDKY